MLDRAIEIAVQAHKGQKTKDGDYYILHPLYVMSQMYSVAEKVVAVLHDVIEDTDVAEEFLRKEFPDYIVDAIVLITHPKDMPYMEYIQRLAPNRLARRVKIKDLGHNLDISRLHGTVEDRFKKKIFDKYLPAYHYLRIYEGVNELVDIDR